MSDERNLPPDEPAGGGDIPTFGGIDITNDDAQNVQVTTEATVEDADETHTYRTLPQTLENSGNLSITRSLFTQRQNAAGGWDTVPAPGESAVFKTPARVTSTGGGTSPSLSLPTPGTPFTEIGIVSASVVMESGQLLLEGYQPVATRGATIGSGPAGYAWWFRSYELNLGAATGTYDVEAHVIGSTGFAPVAENVPVSDPSGPPGEMSTWFGVRRLRVTLSTGTNPPTAQASPGKMITSATLTDGVWTLEQQPFQIASSS